MVNTFIFHGDWIDHISNLSYDQQKEIVMRIVMYGTEHGDLPTDDPVVEAAFNFVKGSIDRSKEKYEYNMAQGQKGGRPMKKNDAKIYILAQEGYTATQIGQSLGISASTVQHSEGWKNRKDKEFLQKVEENL